MKLTNTERAVQFFEDRMTFTTGPVELERMMKKGERINIVDVREAGDYVKGHIPGAISLPKEKWKGLEGLREDRVNILYCYTAVCHLAPEAALEFARKGYPVMELEGGFEAWKENELDVEKEET